MKIESFFPGRLRVSSPLFNKQANLDKATEYLRTLGGIRDLIGNARTGSLTVVYDAARIGMPMLLEAKEEFEKLERGMG